MKRVLLLVALCVTILACAAQAEDLYIPATSADGAWTSPLLAGKTYELTASGTYGYIGSLVADAEWNLQGEMSDEWAELSYYAMNPSYDQDIHDLVIDGVSVNWRGGPDFTEHTYSPDHTYKYYLTGTGASVHLFIADEYPYIEWPDSDGMYYYDDSGGLNVSVNAVPEPSSLMMLGAGFAGMLAFIRRRRA